MQVRYNGNINQLLHDKGVTPDKMQQAKQALVQANPGVDLNNPQVTTQIEFPDQLTAQLMGEKLTPEAMSGLQGRPVAPRNHARLAQIEHMAQARRSKFENLFDAITQAADPGHIANAIADAEAFLASPEGQALSDAQQATLKKAIVDNQAGLMYAAGMVEVQKGPNERRSLLEPTYRVSVSENSSTDTCHGPNGWKNYDFSVAELKVKDTDTGKEYLLDTNSRDISETRDAFKSEPDAVLNDWFSNVSYKPAGGVGKIASFIKQQDGYSGGAHGYSFSELMTFDAQTGKRLRLDNLYKGDQLDKIVAFAKFAMERSPEADHFDMLLQDDKKFKEHVINNFAISTDSGGETKTLTVALPYVYESDRGMMLEASMPLPDSDFLIKHGRLAWG